MARAALAPFPAVAGLVLAALAVLAGACEGAPARSKPWRHARDEVAPPPGGRVSALIAEERSRVRDLERKDATLTIHVNADPIRLNPLYRATVWGRRITMDTVFEPLVRHAPDGHGGSRYEPAALSSWKVSPDGREVRLNVGPGQHFHDGHRVSAVDVQFSLDMARMPRGRADFVRPMLADVSSVELVGPTAVRVRLERPSAYFLRAMSEVPLLPAHVYQGQLHKSGVPIVGSGPYRLAEHTAERIELQRWDGYRGPAPAIERIVFRIIPDAAVALTAAKRGDIDIVPELIPSHYPGQARAPGIVHRFRPLRLSPASLRYLVLHTGRPPFDDARVRRALAHLIDRERIADKLDSGLATPASGWVWPGGPVSGPEAPVPAYDPAEAGRLLDAAGWRADGSGIRRRGGQRLAIDVLVTDEPSPERDLIIDALHGAGIATNVRVGSAAVLENRLRAGDFELAFVAASGLADRDLRPVLGSNQRDNWGRYSSPATDEILDRLASESEARARARDAAELSAQLARDRPVVPLVRPTPYGLVNRRVRGLEVWDGWFSVRSLSLVSE